MPKTSSSKIIAFPVATLFKTIMDIESYPQILSFVRDMRVLERGDNHIIARVQVGLPMLSFSYDCRITFEENKWIDITLISGPFKRLNASWVFEVIDATHTNAIYSLDTEFKNPLMEMTAGALFASQINQSIRAFEERLKRS